MCIYVCVYTYMYMSQLYGLCPKYIPFVSKSKWVISQLTIFCPLANWDAYPSRSFVPRSVNDASAEGHFYLLKAQLAEFEGAKRYPEALPQPWRGCDSPMWPDPSQMACLPTEISLCGVFFAGTLRYSNVAMESPINGGFNINFKEKNIYINAGICSQPCLIRGGYSFWDALQAKEFGNKALQIFQAEHDQSGQDAVEAILKRTRHGLWCGTSPKMLLKDLKDTFFFAEHDFVRFRGSVLTYTEHGPSTGSLPRLWVFDPPLRVR